MPVIGVGVALVAIPIGWLALRTRAATFAIVTLTLVFVGQQLAFNLHSLTGGSQGASMPFPPFALAHFELPFYLVMLGVFALAMLICWWVRGSNIGLLLFAIRDDEDRARGPRRAHDGGQGRGVRRRAPASSAWREPSGRTTSASSTRSSRSTR